MAEYPNRTDLQNSATSTARYTGQTYGEGKRQEQSQQMVRPGRPPTEAQPRAPRPVALTAPSQRRDQPITAGASFGPGMSPMQAGIRPQILPDTSLVDRLIALHDIYPSDRLRAQIQRLIGYNV